MSTGGYAAAHLKVQLYKLVLENFRCYRSLEQQFEAGTTIIDGENGSGKTALIEAIYWQSTGRSFRHHKSSDLIRHQQKQLTVFSEYRDATDHQRHLLGVRYTAQQKKNIKYNGEPVKRQTDVAQQFPVIAIDPGCFLWIDHAPGFRRSYLDWLVFHVEPHYLSLWKQTQKTQQQLNRLLKKGHTRDLQVWQQQYAQLAQQTHKMRSQVFQSIQQRFAKLVGHFMPDIHALSLEYRKGWRDEDLLQLLIHKQELHHKLGYIDIGIHKADLVCMSESQSAQVFLSRGQKKLIAIIMYVIFIELFESRHNKSPVICLDDIDSELDNRALKILSDYLQQQPRQLFITTVNASTIDQYFGHHQVFHVEQDQQNNSILSS